MEWLGAELRESLQQAGVSQTDLARELGVTRQTVVDWINGQVPKGHHLLGLCRLLASEPGAFFRAPPPAVVVAPLHRRRRTARHTTEMQAAAERLAEGYRGLLAPSDMPVLRHVISAASAESAPSLAAEMRTLAGLPDSERPMDYTHGFRLLERLGVCVICHPFPDEVKDYAFFTVIHDQPVVFANTANNVLDLIFPLLHEAVHAALVANPRRRRRAADDDFCDVVAGLVQFPDGYVSTVMDAVRGRTPGVVVNTLKDFAARHGHTVYGIVCRLEGRPGWRRLPGPSVHGADANLRKRQLALADVLYGDGPAHFVETLRALSPLWFAALRRRLPALTTRRLAEALGIDSVLDARLVREAINEARG